MSDALAPETGLSQPTASPSLDPGRAEPTVPARTGRAGRRLLSMREYGMIACLVAIVVFFQIVTGGVLLQPQNLTNIVQQNSYVVVMALGMLLVIVAGHIDLSVGSAVGLVGALAGVLIVQQQLPTPLVIPLCLLAGAAIGAVQGYWVAFWRVPSFIVTLAGMLLFRGLTQSLLDGRSISPFPAELKVIASGFVPDLFAGTVAGFNLTSALVGILAAMLLVGLDLRRRSLQQRRGAPAEPLALFAVKNLVAAAVLVAFGVLLAQNNGLPVVLIVMTVLILAYRFVTLRTVIGRRIYAVGGSEKAAKLSGIRTERLTFLTFVNMGVLAALAGLIFVARLNSATPKGGLGFELDVIAACFIGGASASGGVGKVTGAVVGALIMGVMNNGMSIMGLGTDYQQMIKGIVLLAAVIVDLRSRRTV